MKLFDFDPRDYQDAYRANEYVHIRRGLSEEFYESIVQYADLAIESHKLDKFAIQGKKEQALYDLPDTLDIEELYDAVCAVSGMDRSNVTLSERHMQIYDQNADPDPPAHKDRLATQVAMGFSIRVPAGSQLILYPYSHRETNPFNTSAGFRRHLQPHELPEVVLKGARELVIEDEDRDIVIFPGSNMWHLRRQSANTLNLYLKFNDFGSDPLGEDPFTEAKRAATLAALRAGETFCLKLAPVPSRRLDSVARVLTRGAQRETLQARRFGDEPVGLTELQYRALQSLDGTETVASLATRLGEKDPQKAIRDLMRLADEGIVDLVNARSAVRIEPIWTGDEIHSEPDALLFPVSETQGAYETRA